MNTFKNWNETETPNPLQVYNIYIKSVAEMFGVTHTRPIYERSVEALKDDEARYE